MATITVDATAPTKRGAPAAVPATTATVPTKPADLPYVAAAYILVVVGAVVGVAVLQVANPPKFAVAAGFSVFAGLYIVAQGIERILDPVTRLVSATPTTSDGQAGQPSTKAKLLDDLSASLASARTAPTKDKKQLLTQKAAVAQAALDQQQANTVVILWGLATAVAMVISGSSG